MTTFFNSLISTFFCHFQVALFDNFYIRFLLGNATFFLPPGAITEGHLEKAKRILASFTLVSAARFRSRVWVVIV
jgi:hypothetical protein